MLLLSQQDLIEKDFVFEIQDLENEEQDVDNDHIGFGEFLRTKIET